MNDYLVQQKVVTFNYLKVKAPNRHQAVIAATDGKGEVVTSYKKPMTIHPYSVAILEECKDFLEKHAPQLVRKQPFVKTLCPRPKKKQKETTFVDFGSII